MFNFSKKFLFKELQFTIHILREFDHLYMGRRQGAQVPVCTNRASMSSSLLLYPAGHAKLPHVGAGVVVTVLQGGFGVVVLVTAGVVVFVTTISVQHVSLVHLPLALSLS